MVELNFDKALAFVNKYASSFDKVRLYTVFMTELSKTQKLDILKLIEARRPDHLLSFEYDKANPPSVISSIQLIANFQEQLNMLKEKGIVSDLIHKIIPYQNSDGSWNETEELLTWENLPEWVDTRDPIVSIWVSSLVTTTLALIPQVQVPLEVIKRGLQFLETQIDEEQGGLKGTIHSTFNAAPLIYMRMLGNKEFREKTHKLILQAVSENDFGDSLGYYLEKASYCWTPNIRPVIIEIFRKIKLLQLEDGSFYSEDGEDDLARAHATAQVLIGYLLAEERLKSFQKPQFLQTPLK